MKTSLCLSVLLFLSVSEANAKNHAPVNARQPFAWSTWQPAKMKINLKQQTSTGRSKASCRELSREKVDGYCGVRNPTTGATVAYCLACTQAQKRLVTTGKNRNWHAEVCKAAPHLKKVPFSVKRVEVIAKQTKTAFPYTMDIPYKTKSQRCGSCPKGYEMSDLGCVTYAATSCPKGFRHNKAKDSCVKTRSPKCPKGYKLMPDRKRCYKLKR